MNTKHIHDLTLRLCQALDQNYDVVNMDAVMSVISTLEGTTITKEQLETTRLAKFINHLRRRTKDEHLARRAKSLLKKWREMVGIQQQQQQFIDATSITSSATLPSVSGHNNISYQQQRLRSQSISPAASSMHIDVTQQQSNSNSTTVVAVSSAITEHISRVTNVISASYNNNKRLGNIESQNERTPDASIHTKKQPTSFENVLVGFGVTDRSYVDISSNNSAFRNKLKKQKIVIPPDTETFIIDHSSNSNSEMSLMLPRTNCSANFGPIIIDIQDSNSGSNLVTPISTNLPITTKIQIPGQPKAESVSLDNILNTATATSLSPLKQKKERKEKRRKEKGEYDIQKEIDAFGDSKAATVLLEETSNQQHHRQCGERDEKYSSFAHEEKSRLAYPEILSLLDNSSMSTMFPPENSMHPIEENKVNCSASKSSRTSFNLSTSDLTFAGKFKPSSALLPTTSSTDAVLYNNLRRTVSPKITHVNNFTLHSGRTTSKFAPFRDIGFNSNDSNSYSQASQTDLIDVVSNDKMMPAHRKHDYLNLQNRAVPAINVPTPQLVTTSNVSPSKSQLSNNFEVALNAPVSPEKKVPRKRGRKKGSKGVDSVIAKESSLSSQMLISSLGMGSKKVKTTKELFTEMQNRKLGVTTSSPSPSSTGWQISQQQQQPSRPTSSCSEPSLQSPHTFDACSTNATMSTMATRSTPENMTNIHAGECETTSDTGTSEPSRDSSAVPKHLSFDSNSNIQQQSEAKINTNPPPPNSDTGNKIAVIEKQLIEILKKLPPISLSNAIELKCTAELVPCTCKVIEISQTNNDSDESAKNKVKEGEPTKQNEQTPIYNESFLSEDVDKFAIKIEANAGNTFKSDENVLEPMSPNYPLPPTVSKPKPKKSIFDLDFEEDEDPLPKIKAEAAAASLKKEQESIAEAEPEPEPETIETTDSDFQQSQLLNFKVPVFEHTQLNDEIPMPILPTYEVVEDPKCVAMQRFDLQPQRITKFHIDALHNCFVPNVNGNWDDANYTIALTLNMTLNDVTTADDVEHSYVVTDGSNVVPKYGVFATERIPKDLSHIHFFETSRPNKAAGTPKMFTIPFLGVARSVLLNKFKLNKRKTCHKANGTASTKRASLNDGSAVEQFEANKRIEEYKTDEQGICISIKTENNQTVSGNYNLTDDAKLNESKGLTGICDQLNDAVLSLTKSFDVAAGTIVSKNNNNNVMLKDITIDVVGHGTDIFLANSNELNGSDRNGQNLLAIADHLDYSSNVATKTPLNVDSNIEAKKISKELREYNEIDSTVVTISDSSCKLEGSLFHNAMLPMDTAEKAKNATFSVNNDKNACSRHSSSCSNSTLKQTQPSISLKLKRQLKRQTILDVNTERRSKRRKVIPRSVADNVHVGSASQESKRPRIKRIKIAINGKVATQMQFSGGNSNNSSAEDNEEPPIEGNGDGNEGTPIEDRNKSAHRVTAENEEIASINSPGSHISTHNQCNLGSGDDEIIANLVENNYNDEQEMEYDCYENLDIDGDVEFDENEDIDDYCGDFHEVVTRDISAPSTGNNHIVLTIKKTPSKTNSPSNSLSAISPTIASSNTYGSHASAIISNTTFVQTKNNNRGLDMDALIVKELEVCEGINNQLTSEGLETPNLSSIEEIRPQLQSDVQVDTHPTIPTSIIQQCGGINRFEDPENSPSSPITKSICLKKRKQHRRRKIKKNTKEPLNCLRDVKLHRELFFSHEVIISNAAGIKQSILNFSSCSSSCANDSDYDCNHLEDNISFDADAKSSGTANSEIDIQLESLKRESHEHQRKCNLSASPFTIYSDCSSCDLSTENVVISEDCGVHGSDKVSGDALDLKNNSGIKGGNIDGVKIVDEEDGADNDESILSVNTVISKAKKIPALADSTGSNIEDNVNEELPLENNGLLYSFNNIYYDGRATVDAEKQQEQMLTNKNCDDYNNIYNKNSNNINLISNYIKDPCLKTQINLSKRTGNGNEFKEQNYVNIHGDSNVSTDDALNINTKQQFVDGVSHVGCTGLRVVDEDADEEDGNNCARIQQFKEWHQVLQLRSYNDELLTVLPYVVLD